MSQPILALSGDARTVFSAFVEDESYFALALVHAHNSELQPLQPLFRKGISFQTSLSQLEGILTPVKSCCIILRRDGSLVFITYVSYLANKDERTSFLESRQEFVRQLGQEHFTMSIICKEMGEITDARSWEERDAEQLAKDAEVDHASANKHDNPKHKNGNQIDVGYKKNKCRLCDRRMKNKISPEALAALTQLHTPGAAVQISVNISTETLELNSTTKALAVPKVAASLPTTTPSFTFYRHPSTHLLYFIFHSPDSAPVQERMIHTLAIPGLVNIHAKEQGAHVDQKIEIHDAEDLVFEADDARVGRFRSMYLRNGFQGTESRYDGLEVDRAFYDGVR